MVRALPGWPFHRVLIANRGEIALRVIQACRELGLQSVAVYSEADATSLPVLLADEAYPIGPAPAAASYLNAERILAVAAQCGAQAIHPGYGFLAESAAFAAACRNAGLIFIGPPPEAMQAMGGKIAARLHAERVGVPVVPGESAAIEEAEEALRIAETIGYPIALKASAGGGGRGLKVVRTHEDMAGSLAAAQREGLAYFGDAAVFIERYVDEPRHVEVQILADQYGNTVSLGQRDCSIQRNHQKLIEEAPALIPPDMARAMDAAALHLVEDIGYVGAGTLEFLVDGDRFYFLEMNTRIQVEHTVTEMVTGIDLVQAQLRVAAGEGLWFSQEDVQVRGHALQCRINAEDPAQNFAPTPARVTAYRPPSGPGVRVDSHCYPGYVMPAHYDSLLAKLIVWSENREAARRRMLRALDEFILDGPTTTIGFHKLALEHPAFVQARATTSFLRHLDLAGLPHTGRQLPPSGPALAPAADVPPLPGSRRFQVAVDGKPFTVDIAEIGSAGSRRERRHHRGGSAAGSGIVRSPMHGVVLRIPVSEGAMVERGAVVCVLEAMKMENEVVATEAGIVQAILIKPGETVESGAPLLQIGTATA